jgi:hypothetical protein
MLAWQIANQKRPAQRCKSADGTFGVEIVRVMNGRQDIDADDMA